MTDQKLIAGIFNDFLGLYTGKIQTGIRPLIEKYKNHPMLMGLLSEMFGLRDAKSLQHCTGGSEKKGRERHSGQYRPGTLRRPGFSLGT